jgi:hypothetical protein
MDATPFEISATHCHAMWNIKKILIMLFIVWEFNTVYYNYAYAAKSLIEYSGKLF